MPLTLPPVATKTLTIGGAFAEYIVDNARDYNSPPFGGCAIELDERYPRPVLLLVDVGYNADPPNVPDTSEMWVGSPQAIAQWAPLEAGFAGLLIEYGAGGVSRRIVCDLKAGAYQLPACSFARVSVIAYRDNSLNVFQVRTVSLTLVPDVTIPSPTRPTVTSGLKPSGALAFNFTVPTGGRWFDMWASLGSDVELGDADAPQLITTTTAGGIVASGAQTMKRDYVNEIAWPDWGPVELGTIPLEGIQVAQVNALALSALYVVVGRFWLEL